MAKPNHTEQIQRALSIVIPEVVDPREPEERPAVNLPAERESLFPALKTQFKNVLDVLATDQIAAMNELASAVKDRNTNIWKRASANRKANEEFEAELDKAGV
jgi:hypothetical protein